MRRRSEAYRRLIQSGRWRQLRARVLAESPLCADCLARGLSRSAAEVHHVTPVETGPTPEARERLAFERGNLVGLCHRCHVERHRELGKNSAAVNAGRHHDEARGWLERMGFGD